MSPSELARKYDNRLQTGVNVTQYSENERASTNPAGGKSEQPLSTINDMANLTDYDISRKDMGRSENPLNKRQSIDGAYFCENDM